MRDLQKFCLQLASALENVWTDRDTKRQAAILIRNHAITTPHCYFCGSESSLHESRYRPGAHICRLCARDIHEQFMGEEFRRDAELGNPNCCDRSRLASESGALLGSSEAPTVSGRSVTPD